VTRLAAPTGSHTLIWLPLALFAGIIGFQLFGPLPIGLANNRDFARVLGPLRLRTPGPLENPNLYYKYFVNDYIVADPVYDLGVFSSEDLIAVLAKGIARTILPAGTFQLRIMGFLHAAILTLALFIFLRALRNRAPWVRLVCGFLLIFIWTDLEYVQQLNTAYTDAGAIVALAVVFSIAVHCLLVAGSWPWALSFVLSGCFLLGTKTTNAVALPFLMAFCLFAAFRERRKADRAAWLMAPVFLLATAVWTIGKTPWDYRVGPPFSVVFYKLAVLSPDPRSVLADFRMPEDEFGKYIGHYAFEPVVPIDDPQFRRRIESLVTPSSLGLFYWRHPQILTKVLLFDLHNSAPDIDLSHHGYGHLRQSDFLSGKHPFELVAWDRFRRQLFAVAPFYPIYLFGIAIILSGLCILNRGMGNLFPVWPAVLFSALLAVSSFLANSLLDAIDTARHLVFFQAATDLTIFSVALSICLAIEDPAKRPGFAGFKRLWWLAPLVCLLCLYLWFYRGGSGSGRKPPGVPGTFDDVSDEIVYSGLWFHGTFPDAAGETLSYSNDAGSSARLSFAGTEITWVYARAPNRGIASVKIDGVPRGDFDLYNPTIVWQARTVFRDLAPGKHTFDVTVAGRKDAASADLYIDIDTLVVY